MADDEQGQKPGVQKPDTDKLSEAIKKAVQEMNVQEVDLSQIEKLKPEPDDKREPAPVIDESFDDSRQAAESAGFQEVDMVKTEQFRPTDTPAGGREYQGVLQPELDFAVSETEDLIAAARESTVHLKQNALSLIKSNEAEISKQDTDVPPGKRTGRDKEQENQRTKDDDYER